MDKTGTIIEKFIEKHSGYTSRYKRVILPEGSPLKKLGIDQFELRIDSDDKIHRLSLYKEGTDPQNGGIKLTEIIASRDEADKVRDLIKYRKIIQDIKENGFAALRKYIKESIQEITDAQDRFSKSYKIMDRT